MPVETSAEFRLPRHPEAARLARTFVDEQLRPHLSANVAGNVKMVVSELVNNVVEHGRGEIVLRTELRKDTVRVEVVDEGTDQPESLDGWALRIVHTLAARWGVRQGSTLVWADVPRR